MAWTTDTDTLVLGSVLVCHC